MTDNDIIKALECCSSNTFDLEECNECPYGGECNTKGNNVMEDALDLINRQKAEIERLKWQVNHLKKYDEERDIRLHARLTANARAEAITEFAERLKAEAEEYDLVGDGVIYTMVDVDDIDQIAKEMKGEQ